MEKESIFILYSISFIFFFFFQPPPSSPFWGKILLCSPGWAGLILSNYVNLSSAGIMYVCHHMWLSFDHWERSKNRTKSRFSKTIGLYNQWKAVKEETKLVSCAVILILATKQLKQETNVDILKGVKGHIESSCLRDLPFSSFPASSRRHCRSDM